MSHNGSDHDMFTVADGLLRKSGQKALNPEERRRMEEYADNLGQLCRCHTIGSMPDRTEVFAEMVERGHRILQTIQHIRSEGYVMPGQAVHQQVESMTPDAQIISVDFRARRRT